MIDDRLDEEYEALRKTTEAFAHDEVAPVIGEFYQREKFPYEIVAKMGQMGLFGLPFDESYGGMGSDCFAMCLVVEELARVDSSVAVTLEAGVSLGAMRSTDSVQRNRSGNGCPSCAPVRCSAPSASPSLAQVPTQARRAPPPTATTG
jgi:alkylation response protein AidB-like acyl-CoA dehydrogenase